MEPIQIFALLWIIAGTAVCVVLAAMCIGLAAEALILFLGRGNRR